MSKKCLIVGICGGSASGKTTVTQKIIEKIDTKNVEVIKFDDYYYDISFFKKMGIGKNKINFDHPNSLEMPLFVKHMQMLKKGLPIVKPVYNFSTYKRNKKKLKIYSKDIIIVEGILIFSEKKLRDLIDVKIYVDTDSDERLLRRIKRDVLSRGRSIESVIEQYNSTVKPMHLEFVEPTKRWADVIVPNGGENKIAIEMIVARLQKLIGN